MPANEIFRNTQRNKFQYKVNVKDFTELQKSQRIQKDLNMLLKRLSVFWGAYFQSLRILSWRKTCFFQNICPISLYYQSCLQTIFKTSPITTSIWHPKCSMLLPFFILDYYIQQVLLTLSFSSPNPLAPRYLQLQDQPFFQLQEQPFLIMTHPFHTSQ